MAHLEKELMKLQGKVQDERCTMKGTKEKPMTLRIHTFILLLLYSFVYGSERIKISGRIHSWHTYYVYPVLTSFT